MAQAVRDVRSAEGKATWLPIGLIVLFFAVVWLWIFFGGTPPAPLAALPANPVATLASGQKIAFAAGDLAVGDALLCESRGMSVGTRVPKPGHTSLGRVVNANATAEAAIKIRMRTDGVVIARCF